VFLPISPFGKTEASCAITVVERATSNTIIRYNDFFMIFYFDLLKYFDSNIPQ